MTRAEIVENTRLKKEAKALAIKNRKDAATLAKKEKELVIAQLKADHKIKIENERKAKLEKAFYEKQLKDQAKAVGEERIFLECMYREHNQNKFDLERIKELIRRGESNRYIRKGVLYNIRNAPYELSASSNFKLPFMPPQGKTREHVNGRTAFATYVLWATATGDIRTPEELSVFYKTYCIWILTDEEFNMAIKPYQNDEGAIQPETYIQMWEQTYGPLSEIARKSFHTHFIYNKYGTITRDNLIDKFRTI